MQLEIFEIKQGEIEEVNKFLRSHKILSTSKSFNPMTGGWSICIEYLHEINNSQNEDIKEKQRNRPDYMKLLSVKDFAKFRVLRLCRKKIADEDAVPAYVVCKDVVLNDLVKVENITIQTLSGIKDFGEQKQAKYGERFIRYWNEYKALIPKYIEEGEAKRQDISDTDEH